MRVKIKDKDGLVRDMETKAILNVDYNVLAKDQVFKEKAKKDKEMQSTINNLKEEVASIKGDISKILELLSPRGH